MRAVATRSRALPVARELDAEGLLLGWSLEAEGRSAPMGFASNAGRPDDDSHLKPILHTGGGHLMSFAPTGAGKGIGAVIPALLSYPGPVIVVDPKGENYAVTARRRREMGHEVICLDPFDSIQDQHFDACFNPLELVDPRSPNVADDAMMLAEALSYQTLMENDPFWHVRGKQLLAGLILHVAGTQPGPEKTLQAVSELLYSGRDQLADLCRLMAGSRLPLVRATPSIINNTAERMVDSILAMSQTNLGFLGSASVQRATSRSTFDPRAITRGDPVSVYLIIPPEKLESHAPLLRIWIAALMKLILNRRGRVERNTLFILDEAAQLGHFPPLRQAITLLRGYGLQTWSFWQDLSQLKRLYKHDWETMYNNCRAHQYFGITTPYLAEQIARLTLHDDLFEILDLDSDEMLLSLAGDRPVIAQRPNYLIDTPFKHQFDPNPYHQPKDLEQIAPRRGQRNYRRD
ncbi:MAG: type IV secretory system conjugative DNA transfer family protein [Xanthomonadaceae bacterium]|nr:type IV secretory system conjugative DNA transfer family protein [Xanthomonadaceae bacterium]